MGTQDSTSIPKPTATGIRPRNGRRYRKNRPRKAGRDPKIPAVLTLGDSDSGDSDSGDGFGAGEEEGSAEDSGAAEQTRDYNRAAAAQWLEWVQACEAEQEQSDRHFHWMLDEGLIDEVASVLESGEPGGRSVR